MPQASPRRRSLTGVPDSATEAQPSVGGADRCSAVALAGDRLWSGTSSRPGASGPPRRRQRQATSPPIRAEAGADAPQTGRPRRPARRRPGRRPRSHRAVAARAGPGEHRHYPTDLLAPVAISREGQGYPTGSGPWRSPTHARPARPSGAPPPGARPAPVRPPRPAGPLPPAPPPGPEPLSENSTTTRHRPGGPARRTALAGSAQVSAHPRCCPSSATCSRPLPLRGSAGPAASRLASPCSARRACR